MTDTATTDQNPWPKEAPPLKSPGVTLLVDGDDGCLYWATQVGWKQDILRRHPGPVYAVWTGQYESRVFSLDRGKAERALNRTKPRGLPLVVDEDEYR